MHLPFHSSLYLRTHLSLLFLIEEPLSFQVQQKLLSGKEGVLYTLSALTLFMLRNIIVWTRGISFLPSPGMREAYLFKKEGKHNELREIQYQSKKASHYNKERLRNTLLQQIHYKTK